MKWCETGCSDFDQGAEKDNSANLELINVPYKLSNSLFFSFAVVVFVICSQ